MIFLFSVTSGFGWGTDVQIYPGRINTFDVDYDLGTGTMFLAFQATGEDIIRLYSSSDHGFNWAEIAHFNTHPYQGTTARSNLKRIRVIYNNGWVHIIWVDSLGRPSTWSCTSTGGEIGGACISEGPVVESSLTATLDPRNSGRIYTLAGKPIRPERWSRLYVIPMIMVIPGQQG